MNPGVIVVGVVGSTVYQGLEQVGNIVDKKSSAITSLNQLTSLLYNV